MIALRREATELEHEDYMEGMVLVNLYTQDVKK